MWECYRCKASVPSKCICNQKIENVATPSSERCAKFFSDVVMRGLDNEMLEAFAREIRNEALEEALHDDNDGHST